MCAALGQGLTAEWYTFRSKAEFECWDKKAKADPKAAQWDFKYLGACVGKCNKTASTVCGADKVPYLNACHAKWKNQDIAGFTWTNGPCSK